MGWYHGQIASGEDPFEQNGGTCSLPPKVPSLDTSRLGSIFHICQKDLFLEAVNEGKPYFPPTFVTDGRFTRASQERSSLVDTANHYYKDSDGVWICLELNAQKILALGIQILPQCAPEGTQDKPINCLQIFGGIATTQVGLIISVNKMVRLKDGYFHSIEEKLCNDVPLVYMEISLESAPADERNKPVGQMKKIRNPFRCMR